MTGSRSFQVKWMPVKITTAKAISPEHFVRVLKDVRAEAVRLHKAGLITIYRKGKPVEDPDAFKGVYRLGLPV